jgi:MscS family membrane protein
MKVKLQTCFNAFLALMFLSISWSICAALAQTSASNAVPAQADVSQGSNLLPVGELAKYIPEDSGVTPGWVEHLAADLPFLKWRLWGNEVWKYLASLIYIFLAFYVSKLVDYLARVLLKRWADRANSGFDGLLLDLLNGPIKVVVFVIFLHVGLNIFRWPEKVRVILAKGFTVVVACSLTYMVLKFVDVLMGYWRQRAVGDADRAFNEQLFPVVRKSLKAFVVVVAVLVTAQNLDINVTAAITSLSIGGLAIGLAAQDTLANLFGAIAVFMDRPFQIGDQIRLDSVEGVVESIGMRSTRVRNGNGFLVTIPNKTVGNATIINISRRPAIQTEINLSLAGDTSVERIKRALTILEEIHRSQPLIRDLAISFNKFGDAALNIVIAHGWNSLDYNGYLTGMQQLNLAIKEKFDKEGICLASPSRTVYLRQGSEWRFEARTGAEVGQ